MLKGRAIKILFVIAFGMFISEGYAQLSPGDLTQSHANLEGMSNCTQCHDLGQKVPDSKCLNCHVEINDLLKSNKGYHSSLEVKSQDCIKCHSEHHGRKFNMVRFDTEQFDHKLTGYILQGQHKIIDCAACHKPENIANKEIRKRSKTYLGLKEDCLSCHDDFHQKTLNKDCVICHNFESFRPAVNFNHSETKFSLLGQHVDVECVSCHKKSTRGGVEFQEFSGLAFSDCVDCHSDPHGGLPGKCAQCHTESSFTNFLGQKSFNHNLTQFDLKGKHTVAKCFDCHNEKLSVSEIFSDRKHIDENNCATCHEDVHDGKFGSDCVKCHSESGFSDLKSMDFFDHELTDFPLVGLHLEVDCKSCHLTKFTDEIAFQRCQNCHDDYHNGEFALQENIVRDCSECHTLNKDFTNTTFGFIEHQESAFELNGAHMATPCFACHVDENHWSFRNIGTDCIDCHDDIHKDIISEKYYVNQDCTSCHQTDSWSSLNFDHNLTEWPLEGQHQETNCVDCHFKPSSGLARQQLFITLEKACVTCHENIHGDQFNINGITDCTRCHASVDWTPVGFNHNETLFPLEGKHAELDCRACHKADSKSDNNIVNFKIEKFECIDCHS